MGLHYKSLDAKTREYMKAEFDYDSNNSSVYYSKRFTDAGKDYYKLKMVDHILNGDDSSLAEDLRNNNCFELYELKNTAKGPVQAKVPVTAADTFSEGEFNRFYIRALCLRALAEGGKLIVYRGRLSSNPRPESEVLIGTELDPTNLLADLRANIGMDTILKLPAGPNSGLTIELVIA